VNHPQVDLALISEIRNSTFYQPLLLWLEAYEKELLAHMIEATEPDKVLHWANVMKAYRVLVTAITSIPEPQTREDEDGPIVLGRYRDPLAPRPRDPRALEDVMAALATRRTPEPIDISKIR